MTVLSINVTNFLTIALMVIVTGIAMNAARRFMPG